MVEGVQALWPHAVQAPAARAGQAWRRCSALARASRHLAPTAYAHLDGLQKLGLIERWSTEWTAGESAIHATALGELKDRLNGASAEVTRRLKEEAGRRGSTTRCQE